MKTLFSIIFALLLYPIPQAFARESPQEQIEGMFQAFRPGEIVLVLHAFGEGSFIPKEMLDRIKSQANSAITIDKKIVGYELIEERNFGTSVKRLIYLFKTDQEPLVWIFWFYQPDSEWVPLRIDLGSELFLNELDRPYYSVPRAY